jgi:hypothetical protein
MSRSTASRAGNYCKALLRALCGSERGSRTLDSKSIGRVILVVEENDDVRDYSVMILRELGYTVLESPMRIQRWNYSDGGPE